jgi:tannase/feruloyl esterase
LKSLLKRRAAIRVWSFTALGVAGLVRVPAHAATCEGLAALQLPHVTITSARSVPPGTFTLPEGAPRSDASFFSAFKTLPTFCRVQAVSTPSAGSHIEFEVWLPSSSWNGRYVGAGNGGDGGSINYYRIAEAVNAGYTGSSTDTGHRGAMSDRPDVRIDFDDRAIHETAQQTKAIIRAFYGRGPTHSYFHSCSTGGRQAVTEAERHPDDYDGISAGAPAFTYHVSPGVDVWDPRLKAFKDRGGKLLLYHGERDGPAPSVNYYERVVSTMGQNTADDFLRLYVIPGMGHCGGGPVPEFGVRLWPAAPDAQHSLILAVEQWVERGVAPDAIIGTKYRVDGDPSTGVERTRPLCRYPRHAVWSGSGSSDDAATYACLPITRSRF